jgi:signal transduction histidine kinase
MNVILIVDDEPSSRETLSAMLDGQGYRIESAASGPEGIEKAVRSLPDLILLDVMMPGMDGFEVCRRMRAMHALAEAPILILTALDDHNSLLSGIEAGADDFLTKPVNMQELRARVRTITRLNRYHTLMEQREKLRAMADRIIDAQEQERRRISRELHDDFGQALTSQMLEIRSLQNDLTLPPEELFERLQSLYQHSYEISVKIRRLAQDLRPPMMDTLGLKDAMQNYSADFSRRAGLPVRFEWDEAIPPLPDLHNITLYRALQEALNNIVKHARAAQAWVEASFEDHIVSLTVQDNGRGFDPQDHPFGGIGLEGLRERLTIAGGELKITSNAARGTILTALLPFSKEEK